ncbi:hypothetical protein NEOKW01_1578 [Nematocida sp. AWRm80]|nr:hypothetical protein NEOKW01_1578 [Nematocida sp. AWRm80]
MFARLQCIFCGSHKLTKLKETIYCKGCTCYFTYAHGELTPIYLPTTTKYTVTIRSNTNTNENITKNTSLCTTCSSGEILCNECIYKANSKLHHLYIQHKDKYHKYLFKQRIRVILIFMLTIYGITLSKNRLLRVVILSIWHWYERENKKYLLLLLLLNRHISYLYSILLLLILFRRYMPKRIEYIKSMNIEEKLEILNKHITSMEIKKQSDNQNKNTTEEVSKSTHPIQSIQPKVNLETEDKQKIEQENRILELAKKIEGIRIKENWSTKITTKIKDWIQKDPITQTNHKQKEK